MTGPAPTPDKPPGRLAVRRLLARAAILFEAMWPALWPPAGIVGLYLCAALLGLPQALPMLLHLALLLLAVAATAWLAWRGFRRIRLPDRRSADRRLETSSGLAHRPLSVLSDRPAGGDPLAEAVWRTHAARAAAQIGRLRVGLPHPGLARRDPRALRLALVLALIAALVIAGPDAGSRVMAALTPTLPAGSAAQPVELQAWITPPAYTRVAPIFLKPQGGAIAVPAGSRLTVNVSGGESVPTLALNDKADPFVALDHASFQAERDLARGGLLSVRRDGHTMVSWSLTVIADQPPRADWGEVPGRQPTSQQTRLPWAVSDDYGVVGLQAELHLQVRPGATPLTLTIPLPGGSPKDAHGVSQQDLTAHPWSGLTVTGRLVARDAAGQTGRSTEAQFDLPERAFRNPVARALIAARKTLSLHPDDRADALQILDELMQQPDAFHGDIGAFINLSAIYYLLVRDKAAAAVPQAQQQMWELALHMEEGRTEQTARELEQARQAARDAMDRAQQNPNDATRQALEKRLQELREAIDRHLQALTEEAMRNNDIQPFDPNALQMTNRDLDRMAQQAEQAAREGRMQDAQKQMDALERMLDRLRNARIGQGENQKQQAQRKRGKQQMGAVQDMIQREAGLMDRAQQRGDQGASQPPSALPFPNLPLPGLQPPGQQPPGQQSRGQQPPGAPHSGTQPGSEPGTQAADPAKQREADRRVQQALRRALGELMQQFSDLTGQMPQSLGDADQAMRDSMNRLGQGDDVEAGRAQQQAIEALQKGAREMGQAMAQQFGRQPGQGQEGEEGEGDGGDGGFGMMMPDDRNGPGRSAGPIPGSPDRADPRGRDPLGRSAQGQSPDTTDSMVPEERERQRTQAIQEELRRRGAEQERPRQELDYIDRLLKQF